MIVTDNLFGDIITDLAAMIQGGSASPRREYRPDGFSMFEPMGGSAPKYAGQASSIRWPRSALWA